MDERVGNETDAGATGGGGGGHAPNAPREPTMGMNAESADAGDGGASDAEPDVAVTLRTGGACGPVIGTSMPQEPPLGEERGLCDDAVDALYGDP